MSDVEIKYKSKEIYEPIEILTSPLTEGKITLQITNYGKEKDLGIYLKKSSSMGDVSFPADFEPYIDRAHLLKLGNSSALGGLYFTDEENTKIYFTNSTGSFYKNRISIGTVQKNNSKLIEIGFELPIGISSRRFFVDLVVE